MKRIIGWLLFILGFFALFLAFSVHLGLILDFVSAFIALAMFFGGWKLAHSKK